MNDISVNKENFGFWDSDHGKKILSYKCFYKSNSALKFEGYAFSNSFQQEMTFQFETCTER